MSKLSKDAQEIFDQLLRIQDLAIRMENLEIACKQMIKEIDDTGKIDAETFDKMRELV